MEEENKKEIKIESIGSSISSILLDAIKAHQEHMTVASLGGRDLREQEFISKNKRRELQVRSLSRIISSQMSVIRIGLGIVLINSEKEYNKKYSTEELQKQNPVDDFDCDYVELLIIKNTLKNYLKKIRDAEYTSTLKDDFIITIQQPTGTYEVGDKILTGRFFKMLSDLEDTFETIYGIMLSNGLITTLQEKIKVRGTADEFY